MSFKIVFHYVMSGIYLILGITLLCVPTRHFNLPVMEKNILAVIFVLYGIYRFVKTRNEIHQ